MNDILSRVQLYLSAANDGPVGMSDAVIDEFGEACKKLLRSHFCDPKREEYTMRVSNVGRPLCQQQAEKSNMPREPEPYNTRMKFLIGDMVEAAAVAIMKGAGVEISHQQEPVEIQTGGINLKGTLDVVIDGKLFDIKSASKYAFTNKFAAGDGWETISKDDPFGYLTQGYLYSEGIKVPFGGWIAICKETGEWAILEPPIADNMYRKKALKAADDNITHLKAEAPFKRCFEAEDELWRGKATGNKVLGVTCGYCPYKQACWGSEIVHAANPRSQANVPAKRWYVGQPK